MPDPIHIQFRPDWKCWPEADQMILAHWLAFGLDLIGQNLTQLARTQLDPGWFCTIWSGPSVEEHNRVWKWETGSSRFAFCQNRTHWFLHTGLLPDKMRLPKTWPGHPDQIQVGFAQYDPGLLWKKRRTKLDVGSWMRNILSGLILAAHWLQWP